MMYPAMFLIMQDRQNCQNTRSSMIAVSTISMMRFMQLAKMFLPHIARYFLNYARDAHPLVRKSMFTTLASHLFGGSTHRASNFTLSAQKSLVHSTLARARGDKGLTAQDEKIIASMPRDIRTVQSAFDLMPRTTIYASCPQCSFTHKPSYHSNIATYPSRCQYSSFGTVCGTPLLKHRVEEGQSVKKPIRPYTYHHFHDHVASMLSQKGIEDSMRTRWQNGEVQKEITDILDAPICQEFKGPDGKLFFEAPSSELRLVWAISVDWFNPFENKISGKKVSVGLVSMVCLNLPTATRYLSENIYLVGIIPGPKEPSLDQVNHFLTPLVDDLLAAWTPGIWISVTHKYSMGRMSRSALIPCIADLPASRKTTGHASHSAACFCSLCRLRRHEISNIDSTTWKHLTKEEHVSIAERWRDASNKSQREKLFRKNGIRWSELLRLPYWDPTQFVVVDGMHNIFLGLIARHCRFILGLNPNTLEDEQAVSTAFTKLLEKARDVLINSPTKAKLKHFSMTVLKALCEEQHVSLPELEPGTQHKKESLITALLVRFFELLNCITVSNRSLVCTDYKI